VRSFLLVFLPLLVAYGTTLAWCVDRWNAPTQYFEHCWLVPPLAAVIVWTRRRQWSRVPASPDLRALPLDVRSGDPGHRHAGA
jgi:hypothetical protein